MAKSKSNRTAATQPAKPKGRPQGARNHQIEHAEGQLTRCPKCGSTARGPYGQRLVQQRIGVDASGQPYTQIVRRRTKCLDCGQHRMDRHVEFTPAKTARKK